MMIYTKFYLSYISKPLLACQINWTGRLIWSLNYKDCEIVFDTEVWNELPWLED